MALHTVLDTFLRALPLTLRPTAPAAEAGVCIHVPGPAGGRWTVTPDTTGWRWNDHLPAGTTTVSLAADTLRRLCTRGITPHAARLRAQVNGDPDLAHAALEIVSVIR